jgi:hypothetical protein
MKLKIVKLEIKDEEICDTYYLVNPDKDKLAELKHMIEHRFDYMFDENITDEEFDKAEELVSDIWKAIDLFISANFVTLDIDEIYEIAY